jgi:hypothetical protein
MCVSAQVSLFTFSIGVFFSFLLTKTSDTFYKLMGFFLGYVSLMQFIEYLLWNHQVCDNYNKTISLIGMILNHLQPIVLAILTGYFYKQNTNILKIISLIYLLVIIPYSMQFINNLQCSLSKCTKDDPHIVWQWNNMNYNEIVYYVFLATFVLVGMFGMPFTNGLLFSSGAVLTYTISLLMYERKVMGSLWCFYTAFIPFLLFANSKLKLFTF